MGLTRQQYTDSDRRKAKRERDEDFFEPPPTRQQYRVRLILSVPADEIEDEAEMSNTLRAIVACEKEWKTVKLEVDPWD